MHFKGQSAKIGSMIKRALAESLGCSGPALALALLLACPLAAQDAKPATYRTLLYQDLRSRQAPLPPFAVAGNPEDLFTRPEPEGLRVTLTANRATKASVALQGNLRVSGDFEITGTYELLSADVPDRDGWVAGPALWIWGGDGKLIARLGRFNVRNMGQVYEVYHTNPPPQKISRTPATESSGRLRLVRREARLSYQVSDKTDAGTFKDLFTTDVGADDVTMVRLEVNADDPSGAVDARLIDLRIQGDGQAAAMAEAKPAAATEPESRGWLAGGLILGILTVLLTLAAWRYARGRRGGENSREFLPDDKG
jgi:hypothetical protein